MLHQTCLSEVAVYAIKWAAEEALMGLPDLDAATLITVVSSVLWGFAIVGRSLSRRRNVLKVLGMIITHKRVASEHLLLTIFNLRPPSLVH